MRFARRVFEHEHHPQRHRGAGNVAAAGSIIETLGNVTPGIQMPALRRNVAEQVARVGQRKSPLLYRWTIIFST